MEKESGVGRERVSPEEEYFYRRNRELIEARRRDLDAQRELQKEAQERTIHWMKCPKCGQEMREIILAGIHLDQCDSCHGIYFDAGEMDMLLATQEQGNFFKSLWSRFKQSATRFDTNWKI